MRSCLIGLLLSSCVVTLGCSGSETGGAGGGGGGGDANPNDLTFHTGQFTAPPGESFTCFYLDAKSPRELSVTGGSGEQGPGGHHILIYYTDETRPAQHHPCVDAEMINWHQIAGSAGQSSTGAEGVVTLPPGLAIKVPEGKQFVIQSHYINTSGKAETVDDSVTIRTTEPSGVKAYVNYFANSYEGFEVPPNGSLKAKTLCTVPQDFNVVLTLGHMHEFGTHFTMQTADDTGKPIEMLYDKSWQPLYTSHPPITYYSYEKPMELKKGTKILQTCEWQNTTPDPITFPREMCVGFFYYYPDAGEILCDTQPLP